jgi:hypothetical protein
VHNSVIGVIEDTRLRVAAIDLAQLGSTEKIRDHCKERSLTLKTLTCSDAEIDDLIRELAKSAEVEDLATRRNGVDLGVDDYFKAVSMRFGNDKLRKEFEKPDTTKATLKKWKTIEDRRKQLVPDNLNLAAVPDFLFSRPKDAVDDWKPSDDDRRTIVQSQYGLARLIESVVSTESEEDEAAA